MAKITITTTIPFEIRTKAGLKSFSVGVNPADELDIEHPYVVRLLAAELLTIEVDEVTEEATGGTTPAATTAAAKPKARTKA